MILNLLLFVIIVGMTLLYAKRGAFAGTATFFMTLVALLAAFNYYPLVEYLIVKMYAPTARYADALGLMLTFIATFLLLQYAALSVLEENIHINPVVNAVAGALFGSFSGILFAGFLSISWFMMPGSSHYVKDEPTGVVFDADEIALKTVRFVANERIAGQKPFDPTHTFMRTQTYKFTKAVTRRQAPRTRRGGGRQGVGDRPNLDRQNIDDT